VHSGFLRVRRPIFAVRRTPLSTWPAGGYSGFIEGRNGQPLNRREHDMNVLKNMEVIFLVAAVLAGVSSYASAASADAAALHSAQVSVQGEAKIAVVKISAKRVSA
jgi:hypothetical protein